MEIHELWRVMALIMAAILGVSIWGAGMTKQRSGRMAAGLTAYLALTEIAGFWIIAVRGPKKWLFAVMILAAAVLAVRSVRCGALKTELRQMKQNLLRPEVGMALLVTAAVLAVLLVLYRADADDSFYVSNAALFQHMDRLNQYDSSFGITTLGTVPMYDFQVWESLTAVTGNLFGLEAVSIMHTYSLPILLLCSMSAYMYLGTVLFDGNEKNGAVFYCFMTLFHVFGGYAVFSEGSFLLSRLWQGKAVYLTVVLPLMVGMILEEAETRSRLLWLKCLMFVLAGMALNPTSLYVIGFQLLFMLIILSICKKNAAYLLHAIPSVLAAAFFSGCIYLRAKDFQGQIEAASVTKPSFVIDTLKQFWGTGLLYPILYLAAVIVILWLGSRGAKLYLVWTPLLLALTVWNPIIGRKIAETVTKVPSYWRVFWLIPAGPALSYSVIRLAERFGRRKWCCAAILLIGSMTLILPGTWMFSSENGFVRTENTERIPEELLTISDIMLEENSHPIVLGCDLYATTVRQKYTEIELVVSRFQYILDLFQYRGEVVEASDRISLMEFANGMEKDFSVIEAVLELHDVSYVVLEQTSQQAKEHLIDSGKWKIRYQGEQYTLFEYKE